MIPPKRSDIFPPDWEMLRRSRRVLIFLDGNGPGDIWGTTDWNKDEELKTFWNLWFFGNIAWGITRGGCEAYLVTLTDRCSFLCVSSQRGTIANKSM